METINDLAAAKPHQPDGARYSVAEWRAYCEGYYMALSVTGRALEEALARAELADRTKRAITREQREKSGVA